MEVFEVVVNRARGDFRLIFYLIRFAFRRSPASGVDFASRFSNGLVDSLIGGYLRRLFFARDYFYGVDYGFYYAIKNHGDTITGLDRMEGNDEYAVRLIFRFNTRRCSINVARVLSISAIVISNEGRAIHPFVARLSRAPTFRELGDLCTFYPLR